MQRGRHTKPQSAQVIDSASRALIKFKHCDLGALRERLLSDLSREHFAILLGKAETIGGCEIINVYDMRFPTPADYIAQGMAHLRLRPEYLHEIMAELAQRHDVDSIIDVHTHPFSHESVHFSSIDDHDERVFFKYLASRFKHSHYGSVVLSQTDYSARVWGMNKSRIIPTPALVKTQTAPEGIESSDFRHMAGSVYSKRTFNDKLAMFSRSVSALGLDSMRRIMDGQTITIVGVGGLGSVVAEHLIHEGFQEVILIDPDRLELSNLNRIVGASYQDAVDGTLKVDAIKCHLLSINPKAHVAAFNCDVYSDTAERLIAFSDWVIVATDNHSSRFRVQELSIKYFVPMISVGVNISVRDEQIEDISGEVITARVGDKLCLNCLRRINHIKMASETHPDEGVRQELVTRGYISGATVAEPAVKTLNTMLATIAVRVLINQYTERQRHVPVLVYEDNAAQAIYEDSTSVAQRNLECYSCNM